MARITTGFKRPRDLMTANMYNDIVESINILYDRSESNKGVYDDASELPEGKNGDFAMVLTGGAFPATIYRHDGVEWSPTSETWSPDGGDAVWCEVIPSDTTIHVSALGVKTPSDITLRLVRHVGDTETESTLSEMKARVVMDYGTGYATNVDSDSFMAWLGSASPKAVSVRWYAEDVATVTLVSGKYVAKDTGGNVLAPIAVQTIAVVNDAVDYAFDETPTENSHNLVDSGTVFNETSRIAKKVEGGTDYLTIDMSDATQTEHYRWLTHGSIKRTASGTYRQWVIANDGYTHVHAYLGLNSALPNGDGFAFLIFQVPADFEPDPNEDYIFSKHGATYVEDGVEYTISNYNSGNFLYYEEDVARARKNTITIERDVPEGTTYIIISTRNSAVTDVITLTKAVPVVGLEEKLTDMDGRVEDLEGTVSNYGSELEGISVTVHGGDVTSYVDLTSSMVKGHYINASLKRISNSQFQEWRIANKGYTHVKVYLQGYIATGGQGITFITFYNDGVYTAPEEVTSDPSGRSNSTTTRVGLTWYECDIPEGTAMIVISAMAQNATNLALQKVIFTQVETVEAVEERMAEIRRVNDEQNTELEKMRSLLTADSSSSACQEITPSDKAVIPSYYLTRPATPTIESYNPYLEQKIQSIPEGKHFIFVTDTHWRYNAKKSPALITYVRKRTGIPFVIFGGDAMHRPANQDTESAEGSGIWSLKGSLWHTPEDSRLRAQLELSEYCMEMKERFGDHFLFATGNHDLGLANLSGYTATDIGVMRVPYQDILREAHTASKRIAVYDEQGIKDVDVLSLTTEEKEELIAYIKQCYYVDDAEQKIRYIITITGQGSGFDGIVNTVFGLGGNDCLCSQLKFIASALMTLPEGYDVVLVGHWFMKGATQSSPFRNGTHWMLRLIDNYRAGNKYTVGVRGDTTSAFSTWMNASPRTYDFSSANVGRIIIIQGHRHVDNALVVTQSLSDYYTGSIKNYDATSYMYDEDEDVRATTQYLLITVHRDGGTAYAIPLTTATGGTIDTDCAFDIVTLTEDSKVVCTRIGYGNDREYILPDFDPENFVPESSGEGGEEDDGGIDE